MRVRVRVRVRVTAWVRPTLTLPLHHQQLRLLGAVDARRELDVEPEVVVGQQVEEGGRQLEGARPEHLGVRDRVRLRSGKG